MTHWIRTLAAVAILAAATAVVQPAEAGRLARKHTCHKTSHTPTIRAYNLGCTRARAVWRHLPAGWLGANRDVDGGIVLLYRAADQNRVFAAMHASRVDARTLGSAPLVLARVAYGE
jgi:hypothetical protein